MKEKRRKEFTPPDYTPLIAQPANEEPPPNTNQNPPDNPTNEDNPTTQDLDEPEDITLGTIESLSSEQI